MGRQRTVTGAEECNVARIRLHYQRLGLAQGWDLPRVWRLCQLLHCTVQELGALANMPAWKVDYSIRHERFNPEASLHFALLERAYLDATGLTGESVVPLHLIRSAKPHETGHD